MKLQNKPFHKSWINNVQNREKDTTKKFSIKKYILKIIIISLIVLSIIIIIRWWQKVPNKEILNIDKDQEINQPDTLVKPVILFKNKNKSIFTVKAYEAKKDISNSAIIILKKPEGHYKLSNEKDMYFYATKGILNNNKNILELKNDVIIESSRGTKFFTNEITYNVDDNLISSNENIIVDGSWGSLNGKGFIYNLENSTINLKGRPILSLSNNKGNIK
ncbi:MAG: Lipopolysaccharide export system protein LptC [Alphaproteobacteria bacterium MarineAlpha9_Bin3]|nr:MAG: Lipopolysaccharide export system protein LptC [Alphaproteobacteria bacterium MarineAlpha9_Bin3]|tara:strand:+ start:4911 stop:5567 length:657 start_codon:yes stop_codon:yes gene_type:complete